MKKRSFFLLLLACTAHSLFATDGPQTSTKAFVHVYRPGNLVGCAWNFILRANGERIASVKNNRHQVLEFEPSQIKVSIKNKEVILNLEPGKHYYLRSVIRRGWFIGSPELVEVTPSFAQQELQKSSMKQG